MLGRALRATREEIEKTIKSGINIPDNNFYAKVSRENGKKLGFAIIVSKKTEKTSVGRHLIKRKISAALEASIPKIRPDFNKTVVLFAKKPEKRISFKETKNELVEILKKAKVF
jgi:ribonuclease P protein component